MANKTQNIIVIGAGIIGLTTAQALIARGHHVTLIDRGKAPAQVCSFANAGLLTSAHTQAWGNPRALKMMIKAYLGKHPSVKITKLNDPELWAWGIRFLRECLPWRSQRNTKILREMATESLRLMQAEGPRSKGAFYLFEDAGDFQSILSDGIYEMSAAQVNEKDQHLPIDPARHKHIAFSELDFAADCHNHANQIANALTQSNKCTILYETEAVEFDETDGKVSAIITTNDRIECDQVVIANGLHAKHLTRKLGENLSIYPVKGYSSTWKITDHSQLPNHPYIDETNFVAVATLGDNLRVTSIAEFAGEDTQVSEFAENHLRGYVRSLYSGAVDMEAPTFWAGLRPATPSTLPYLGALKSKKNVWVNAGHGQLGWTLAYVCADEISRGISGENRARFGA